MRDYLRLLRRHGWLVVLVPVLAVVLAAVLVHRQKPVYRASTEIFVAQAGGPAQPQLGNLPLIQTMTNILESNVIATAATRELRFALTPTDLLGHLGVQEDPSSSILTVTYDSSDTGHALGALQAVETTFQSLIRRQLGASGSLQKTGPLQIVASVIDPPHVDPGRLSPNPSRTLAFAAGIGLVIGLIVALVRNALDDRIRGRRDAEESFGAPVLGVLPKGSLVPASVQRDGPELQALQLLGASLQLHHSHIGRSLLVTSALEDDASCALVATLGYVLARAGQRIVCVGPDGARRNLGIHFAMSSDADSDDRMASVLAGALPLSDALVQVPLQPSSNGTSSISLRRSGSAGSRWVDHVEEGHLMVLPGAASPKSSALVSYERLGALVEKLSESANYVLYDCPRPLSVGRGLALASLVDSVLVVARDGHTRRERARAVQAALNELGVQKMAVVLIQGRSLWRRRAEI
ncbi:MAG: Wzz/FepE/Etk N-terminal domain-containing protein [Solirubrobacteraceae bacterium]